MKEKEPRRRFLRQVFTIVPASILVPVIVTETGCSQSAATEEGLTPSSATASAYAPTFFTDAEWAFVKAAVDHLIPRDQYGPGANDAGVPEFIDRQMEMPYGHGKLWYMQGPFHPDARPELGLQMNLAPRDVYRHGVVACNDWCTQAKGKVFADLDAQTREQILEELEKGRIKLEGVPSKMFFKTLLANTKEGFLSDPMYGGNKNMVGWKMIGFPGARADFTDWVDQPGATYPLGPVSIRGEQS